MAVAMSVALAAFCLVTSLPAADAEERGDCAPDGPTLPYLVLFDQGTSPADADAEVRAACGTTSVYYPEIAVAVVRSDDSRLVEKIGRDRAYSARSEALRGGGNELKRPGDMLAPADDKDVPSADRSAEQWDMRMISADAAHRVSEGSRDVLVGVLDSGIDPHQPDLTAALDQKDSAGCVSGKPLTGETEWEPTTSWHGTHVAGTIAAADDGKGITGVAPGVRVASVKVVDDEGYIYPEAAVCGLLWAARSHMTVTNNSYFVDPWLFTCEHSTGQHVVYEAMRRAAAYAESAGVLNVVAATNTGLDLSNIAADPVSPDNAALDVRRTRELAGDCVVLPAGLPGTVTVSAVGADGVKAGYSAYGLGAIDVTAPGGDLQSSRRGGEQECVLSTVPGGYTRYCGTSMATPHVTGVAALLASTHPGAAPAQLRELLGWQARPVTCPDDYDLSDIGVQDAFCGGYTGYNGFYGHGMVDALAAVSRRGHGPDTAEVTGPLS
jgi:subtilisin family serine protease